MKLFNNTVEGLKNSKACGRGKLFQFFFLNLNICSMNFKTSNASCTEEARAPHAVSRALDVKY